MVKNVGEIDMNIYKNNGSLRLPWANKVKDENSIDDQFTILEGCEDIRDPYNYLVHLPLKSEGCGSRSDKLQINYGDYLGKLKELRNKIFPDTKYYEEEERVDVVKLDIEKEDMVLLDDKTGSEWKIVSRSGCFTYVALVDRQKGCPCCSNIHDSNNWNYFKFNTGYIGLRSYACNKTITIASGDKKIKDTRARKSIVNSLMLKHNVREDIDVQYLSHLIKNDGILDPEKLLRSNVRTHYGIKSNTGTGKTKYAMRLIRECVRMNKTVLLVAPLTSLTEMIRDNIAYVLRVFDCKIGYYRETDDFEEEHDVFVCTPESLATKSGSYYDVVIYDEITSVMSSFDGATMKERLAAFNSKNKTIQSNVSLSVMIDAHLKSFSDELVGDKKIVHITNNRKEDNGTVEDEVSKQVQQSKMTKMVDNGENFAFCSTSATIARSTEALIVKHGGDYDRILTICRPEKPLELESNFIRIGCYEARIKKLTMKEDRISSERRSDMNSSERRKISRLINRTIADRKDIELKLKEYCSKTYSSRIYSDYRDKERKYLDKLRMLVANKDDKKWWKQWSYMIYSPSIMVGLDFNTSVHEKDRTEENREFWYPHFSKIFCHMKSGILDVFQSVQMMRRFRQIRDYNVFVEQSYKGSMFPLLMSETKRMTDKQCAIALKLRYRDYADLDENMKTILKSNICCKNSSNARYKELLYYLLEEQGISLRDTEKIAKKDLIEKVVDEYTEYIQIANKNEEYRINTSLSNRKLELERIKIYRDSDMVCKDMEIATVLALFLVEIVADVDVRTLIVGKKYSIPVIKKQKLSKYKDCPLTDRVCEQFYKSREEMNLDTVGSLVAKFQNECRGDFSVGGDLFDIRQNSHLYERLGFYSSLGFSYVGTTRPSSIVNGRKGQRIQIAEVTFLWEV